MDQLLVLLLSLALLPLCTAQTWKAPDFCHQRLCPQYQVVETNKGFEERLYVATEWITTKVESADVLAAMAAHSRLKNYCQSQKKAGYTIPTDTWPVLATVTEGGDMSMSWFLPPGTVKPEKTNALVTVQSRPAGTVYVRVFGGYPVLGIGADNAKKLRDSLVKAGKTFNPDGYSAATYDSIMSLSHHNEIWIQAA